jgi:hypothetical protein
MDRREEFLAESPEAWKRAIAEAAGPNPPDFMICHGLDRIREALQPFMGSNRSHALYPSGGGIDFKSVEIAAEEGCLSFSVGDRLGDIMKPSVLTFEYFPQAPMESFLLLELAQLRPSGVYEHSNPYSEQLLEYPPGEYLSRDLWEWGYLWYDENGWEVPLPEGSRPVSRWLGGKVLIVAKGSLWNSDPSTYDGRHNSMAASEIRTVIERSLPVSLGS